MVLQGTDDRVSNPPAGRNPAPLPASGPMTISVVLSLHTRAQSCPLTFLSLLQYPRIPSRLRSPLPDQGSGKHAICLIPAVRHVDRRIAPPPKSKMPT